jgi:hypothetical protein
VIWTGICWVLPAESEALEELRVTVKLGVGFVPPPEPPLPPDPPLPVEELPLPPHPPRSVSVASKRVKA